MKRNITKIRKMANYNNYQSTRFKFNNKRRIAWQEISKYLQRYIPKDSTIVDLGSGYCDFINEIKAKNKIAVDAYINPKNYCNQDIKALFCDYKRLNKELKNDSVDIFFLSNFLEHLSLEQAIEYIKIIKNKLKASGKIIIMQPNYKYCFRSYFDDYTHIKAWSDESLRDFLKSNGFRITKLKPKFLPFSVKSKLPASKILIKLYLHSPLKPFGKQMLIIAELNKNVER